MMRSTFSLSVLAVCLFGITTAPAITFFYTTPYYGRSDSPFYAGIQAGTIYIEDFEDRLLNTPYVTATGGGISPAKRAAVDEDDGIKDGKTTFAYTWSIFSMGTRPPIVEFSFSPNAEGKLPEYVGAALVGGDLSTVGMDIYSKILAYDGDGKEITLGQWQVLLPRIPAGTPSNSSIADHFAGIYYLGGISRIYFPNTDAIDHLQYGYAIPEPGAAGLLAIAGMVLLGKRTRRRGKLSARP